MLTVEHHTPTGCGRFATLDYVGATRRIVATFSLHNKSLVTLAGFEPATACLGNKHSSPLSYRAKIFGSPIWIRTTIIRFRV
jgi:hypothetical protein